MGCFYQVKGEVLITLTEDAKQAVKKIGDLLPSEFNLQWEPCYATDPNRDKDGRAWLRVEVDGGDQMSYGTACQVDELLRLLGPFAVEPARFTTRCDDEDGFLWVGPDAASIARAQRQQLVDDARDALLELTAEERFTLIAEIKT